MLPSRKINDLHMHFYGSLPLSFLEETAKKNGVDKDFQALLEIREQYREMTAVKDAPKSQKSIELIWRQFALINSIMQTLEDVKNGVVKVMEFSKANYMEIRTRPKEMQGADWLQYVEKFISGLLDGNNKGLGLKHARGLLSLDRTVDNEERGYQIIDRVVLEKRRNAMLTGIDISGNPVSARSLTGDALLRVLRYALDKGIGISVHIGEVDNAVEQAEVDGLLNMLITWHNESPTNLFPGKVRLGHGIFLSEKQRTLIKQWQIPMEITPACHEKVWNIKMSHHPVINHIYSLWHDPVVPGTDDALIFGSDAIDENQKVIAILGCKSKQEEDEAYERQIQHRFGH